MDPTTSGSIPITSGSLVTNSNPPPSTQSSPRWLRYVLIGLVAVVVLAVAAWPVELPYYAYSSGPVRDALNVISVEDEELASYPPSGELLMLTVSLQKVNIYEAVQAELDPAVDLVRVEAIRQPDETDEEFRNRGLQAMDSSIINAITVAFRQLDIPLEIDSDGVLVIDRLPDTPSAQVLQNGDVITSLEGKSITALEQLQEVTFQRSPGDQVELTIDRNGTEQQVVVELVANPEDSSRAQFGIMAGLHNPTYPIDVNSEVIGGPSAGLMYTLAIIDTLEPGDLTGGRIVAGTGTVSPDGTVGPIGGVRQKAVAAELAGAEYMLVPVDNLAEAHTAPIEDLQLIAVNSVQEALAFLDTIAVQQA